MTNDQQITVNRHTQARFTIGEGWTDYSHDGPCTLENCQAAREIAKERGIDNAIDSLLCRWGCGRIHHGACSKMVSYSSATEVNFTVSEWKP